MSATPLETASNTSKALTSCPAPKTWTLRRPPVIAVIALPSLSALLPRPGKPFGQLVTILSSRAPCAMAGAGNVADTPATAPARVKKLRLSMARFLWFALRRLVWGLPPLSGGVGRYRPLLCCHPNDSTPTALHCGISDPSMSALGHKQTRRSHLDVRFTPVGSIGRCNTSIKSFGSGFEAQSLARSFVELPSHSVELRMRAASSSTTPPPWPPR